MRIFVDMDEVIADTYQEHINIYNKEFNANFTKVEAENKCSDFWKCVPPEHQQNVKDHARQVGFFRNLAVIPHSQEVLKELYHKHEVYIASAAMQFPNSLKEKSDWLDEFFPFIKWQHRILCGDKHMLKGDVLIDDRAYNLERFEGRAILFTSPHNIGEERFERVSSWLQIAEMLV